MDSEKTLNEWMKDFGYRWVAGKEQLFKAPMAYSDAMAELANLHATGAITRA